MRAKLRLSAGLSQTRGRTVSRYRAEQSSLLSETEMVQLLLLPLPRGERPALPNNDSRDAFCVITRRLRAQFAHLHWRALVVSLLALALVASLPSLAPMLYARALSDAASPFR